MCWGLVAIPFFMLEFNSRELLANQFFVQSPIRKTIEKLIKPEFDKSLDDFPDVRRQFTDSQSKNDRVNIILDYFERHQEEFPKFLEAIKNANPTAYENYYSELSNDSGKNNNDFVSELKQILNNEDDDYFWECLKEVYQYFLLGLDESYLEQNPDNLFAMLLDL